MGPGAMASSGTEGGTPVDSASSDAITRGLRVRVHSAYVPERSRPAASYFFFAYRVQITNEGPIAVKLLSRHWFITDGDGNREEVRGPGVVGEQPFLEPNDTFTYTSACPLHTRTGTMNGLFQMLDINGERFDAEVAPFGLIFPGGPD